MPANTISFTVNNPNFDPIESLTINTPDNLSQNYDAMEPVEFTVAPAPASNIDISSIRWYVNDELQSAAGTTFQLYAGRVR